MTHELYKKLINHEDEEWLDVKDDLAEMITRLFYQAGMIKTWYRDHPEGWTLVSGKWSPLYINLRPLPCYPDILEWVGRAMRWMISEEVNCPNKIVGIASAGVPIATAISLYGSIPMCYTRKMEGVRSIRELNDKIIEYGHHRLMEGEFCGGESLVLVDDLVTKLDSKLIARDIVMQQAKRDDRIVFCDDVAVVLDREQGASEMVNEHGMRLYALIPFLTKGMGWIRDYMDDIEYDTIQDYLLHEDKYQSADVKDKLIKKANKHLNK